LQSTADPISRTRAPAGLVVAAFVLMLSSTYGQTYFIAVFAPDIKRVFGLSDGGFGSIYTVATIASAATLIWVGKFADQYRIRVLASGVMIALAGMCLAMALVPVMWLLAPILMGLRLFGQGLSTHLAITGVGRWYKRRRGRMMSVSVLGFSTGEAVLPFTAVVLIGAIGWRETWLISAAFVLLVSLPLVLLFLRHEPAPDAVVEDGPEDTARVRDWTRAEVMRSPVFHAVVAGVVSPAFVFTGVFFHQAYLVEAKGWTLVWYTSWFPAYAVASVLTAIGTGFIVDRIGARRLLPLFLLPMCLGVLVLALSDSLYAVPAFMLLAAGTAGSSNTLLGALWAELFGTRHLGAIRSVAVAAQVFATALAPGLIGILLDLGVSIEAQFLAMVAYGLLASLGLALLGPRLNRIAGYAVS